MTRNAETPEEDATQVASRPGQRPAEAGAQSEKARSGPVAELALVAGGLGLAGYLLGFVAELGAGAGLTGALLLGGGLLAASSVLPGVGTRILVPAAVATVTGALLLLQTVVGGRDSALAIAVLVLALLAAAAAAGAALLDVGVLHAPAPRPKAKPQRPAPVKQQAPVFPGYPQQPAFPGQQYPGQPYPGGYAGRHPGDAYSGDQYAGEHVFTPSARYGGQYGAPGYPPPYSTPAFDPGYPPQPAFGRSEPGRTDAPVADRPAAEPAGGQHAPAQPASPEASTPEPTLHGSEVFRPANEPPAAGAHRAVAAEGAVSPAAQRVTPPDGVQAAGSHRAPAVESRPAPAVDGPPPVPGHVVDDGDTDDRTQVLPTVPQERPTS
jgi:Family of unknown function (DUF5336)